MENRFYQLVVCAEGLKSFLFYFMFSCRKALRQTSIRLEEDG